MYYNLRHPCSYFIVAIQSRNIAIFYELWLSIYEDVLIWFRSLIHKGLVFVWLVGMCRFATELTHLTSYCIPYVVKCMIIRY